MSATVITVENLSKSYVLKHRDAERHNALRDVIASKAKNLFNAKQRRANNSSEIFFALDDVSFEVKQGDRLGIIGRNGAGKSTLLKILSRIVSPTKGRITIDGKVASLLEVGTGFHAELSGRENIYLNGSILGMTKAEIKNKFDEIVAFSEVEKFLDTPVKRYSSGMYVRLAFAVTAHLEPDILIVDEVLAVGDAEFQKKCLGKMKDVSGEGRTVLFVSHNMGQISALCSKAVILNKGKIEYNGAVDQALKIYYNIQSKTASKHYYSEGTDKEIFIREAEIKNKLQENTEVYTHDEPIYVHLKFAAKYILNDLLLSISVSNTNDVKIFSSERSISNLFSATKKDGEALIKIPSHFLAAGEYKLQAGIHIPNLQIFDSIESICSFSIVDNGSEYARYAGIHNGYVYCKCEWELT